MTIQTPITDAIEAAQTCKCHPYGGFNCHHLGCPLYSIVEMRNIEADLFDCKADKAALIAALETIGSMTTVGPLAACDMANVANAELAGITARATLARIGAA